MLRVRGEVFTPYVARLLVCNFTRSRPGRSATAPGSRGRSDASPVAPSRPPLVAAAPIVVLVTVDALRADVVNDDRFAARFPAIRALRDRSVNFVNARSTAPQTAPSITSIMTGKTYSMIRWTPERAAGRLDVLADRRDASVHFPHGSFPKRAS